MLYTEKKYKSNFDFLVKSFWGSSSNKVSFLENKTDNNKNKIKKKHFFYIFCFKCTRSVQQPHFN